MNKTINLEKFCAQLNLLKAAIEEIHPGLANRLGVIIHQDNARPRVSVNTLLKLKGFGWDILNDSPHSPDMVPSDYYLFHSTEHALRERNFSNLNDI